MAHLISGKEISLHIKEEIKQEIQELHKRGIQTGLAVVLVGNDPASEVYVRNKRRTCENLGMKSISHDLPADTSQADLEKLIDDLNQDQSIHGILCQFPLPSPLNETRIIQRIDPKKDVDGLHPYNVGLLSAGAPQFVPCTPLGCMELLKRSGCETKGKHAVVLGRSNLVGRPMAALLSQKGSDATVTLCHSRTQNLSELLQRADIIIAALGKPEFITAPMVKEGVIVIDVGINRVDDEAHPRGYRLLGDVCFEEVEKKADFITPVPGGVGPMTIAMLMQNTVLAAKLQHGLVKH